MAAAPRHDDLKLHLFVLGQEHEISAKARIGPTQVLEVLPLARTIADGVTQIALEEVKQRGEKVSCQAGCSACCRQMVPIAPAEAIRLAEVVEKMPAEQRQAVKARFHAIVKRLEEVGLIDARAPRGRAALLSPKATPQERWEDVSLRYFAMQLACPFLEQEACSIYTERPAACREYHVTTPATLCETLDPALSVTPRPVRMGEVLKRFTNKVLGRNDPNVPLPLALEWAGAHKGAFHRQKDGETLAMTLVSQIQEADDAEP